MKTDQMLVDIRERSRLYISTPERAAEALLFARNLEKFADELKENVKERTVAIMDRDQKEMIEYTITDDDTGEVRTWQVKRSYSTQTKEYRPQAVVQAFGIEESLKFFKVGKTELEKWMKRAVSKGDISDKQIFTATEDPIIKTKKGSGVIMREIKA